MQSLITDKKRHVLILCDDVLIQALQATKRFVVAHLGVKWLQHRKKIGKKKMERIEFLAFSNYSSVKISHT